MRLYRQKQTFILLEILVAIATLSLLAGFLIYRPFRELQKELQLIISLEEDRVWEGQLIQIESDLRKECATLPREEKNAKTKEFPFTIYLPNMEKNCKRTYKCWANYNCNDKANAGYLIHLAAEKRKDRANNPGYKFFIPEKL